MIHDWRNGGRVDGSLCLEGLDVIEGRWVKQLVGNGETSDWTIDSGVVERRSQMSAATGFSVGNDSGVRVGPHLCGVVLGGADEHGQVHWGLDVVDVPGVLLGFLQDLPRLPISDKNITSLTAASQFSHFGFSVVLHLGADLVDLSVLVSGDHKLPQRAPHGTGDLVVVEG